MRYFMFAYDWRNNDDMGSGFICVKRKIMPNIKTLTELIRIQVNEIHTISTQRPQIIISNIFEFKSRKDYLNFTEGD